MKYSFTYKIDVQFSLTKDEFDLITEAIKHGERSYAANHGEWWYGNMNRFNWWLEESDSDKEELPLSGTFSQIDRIIMKSLELHMYRCLTQKDKNICANIFIKFMNILNDINESYTIINKEIIIKEI